MKKMLKRLLCIVLSFVLMLAVVSIGSFSTAALTEKIPTQLYIGGNGEYGNVFQGVNIARMLTGGRKHVGYTYNQNSYRFKYYENDDKDYVLYLDGYNMTEPYVYNENAFGIYCVGDLIIDFCNANSFTVFENIKSIGIYVSGVLTLRSDGGILSSLTAEGGAERHRRAPHCCRGGQHHIKRKGTIRHRNRLSARKGRQAGSQWQGIRHQGKQHRLLRRLNKRHRGHRHLLLRHIRQQRRHT